MLSLLGFGDTWQPDARILVPQLLSGPRQITKVFAKSSEHCLRAALVSLYGLFASPAAISDQLSLLAGILPQGAVEILREQIGRLTAGSGAKLGFGFVFGLAVALWSANAGMKAIMDALSVVYEEKEKRGFIKLNLISLAFTIALPAMCIRRTCLTANRLRSLQWL
jgi:hypothetical protein